MFGARFNAEPCDSDNISVANLVIIGELVGIMDGMLVGGALGLTDGGLKGLADGC